MPEREDATDAIEISADRLRGDLLANGEFGAVDAEGHGRTVLTGTPADRSARERFVETLESLGLSVRVDPVGNIAGRWVPETADPDAAPVAAGSHLDSVPRGGIFDGPLGVYAAVEAVRAMRAAAVAPERPVEVVSFTEEEGQRFTGLLGSSAATGVRSVEETLAMTDDEGVTLRERLEDVGFHGDDRIDPAAWDAWLELHIEQSTELESAGVPVGIVPAITGITNATVTITGTADHAGGTRMPGRRDALAAAAEFVRDVERAAREVAATDSGFAVATVGDVSVEPGARNVIPGRAELSFETRDVDAGVMDALVDRAEKSLARIADDRGVDTEMERYRTVEPAHMSDRPTGALRAAADAAGLATLDVPSGGGHDTMRVARVTETGMQFAPSRDGVSHSPREWTDWADCAACAAVMAGALADLAGCESTAATVVDPVDGD